VILITVALTSAARDRDQTEVRTFFSSPWALVWPYVADQARSTRRVCNNVTQFLLRVHTAPQSSCITTLKSVDADSWFSNIEALRAYANPLTDGMWHVSGPTISFSAAHWLAATDYILTPGWDGSRQNHGLVLWTQRAVYKSTVYKPKFYIHERDHPAINH